MSKESKLLELYVDKVLNSEMLSKIGTDYYLGKIAVVRRYDNTLEAKWLVSSDMGFEEIPNISQDSLESLYTRLDRFYNDKQAQRLKEFYQLQETLNAQKQA